jgi:hypothetical protein
LLSHISALGAHRESNLVAIKNLQEISRQITEVLNKAGNYLLNREQQISDDISPLLLNLQKQIVSTGSGLKKQNLRIIYNIADTASKIIRELDETWDDR